MTQKAFAPAVFDRMARMTRFIGRFGIVLALTIAKQVPDQNNAKSLLALLDELASISEVPMIQVARSAS